MTVSKSQYACDSHFHVFGPEERYPYSSDLRYSPPYAPLEDYLVHAHELGLERFVFVQPSAYGRDNRCMLDAMQALGAGKCRGIADIDEDAPASELERLHAAGVRGVRINVNPIKPPEPGFSETLLKRICTLDAKCAELGWMLDFLTPDGSHASSSQCSAICIRAFRSPIWACSRRWRARSSRGSWNS